MNILITGGTGFIGKALCQHLEQNGHSIICLSRSQKTDKSNKRFISNLDRIHNAEKIEAVINLAGAPISKRWSPSYKEELVNSRINTTLDVIRLIARLETKPDVLINASAIGYYGCQGNNDLHEDAEPKQEFTHDLCHQWEQAAKKANELGVRTCIIRLGVVLGKNGGALSQMLPAFKLGLGGKISSGEQYFSWIHLQDVINAISFLIKNGTHSGVFNLTSPNPVTNAQFSKALAKSLNRPCFFTTPSFVIKLLFSEMGETLLLNGQKVIPSRLLASEFDFKYPELSDALNSIVK